MKQATMLYKHPGPHQMLKGSYDYIIVDKVDEEVYDKALEDGWYKTPTEALENSATKGKDRTLEEQRAIDVAAFEVKVKEAEAVKAKADEESKKTEEEATKKAEAEAKIVAKEAEKKAEEEAKTKAAEEARAADRKVEAEEKAASEAQKAKDAVDAARQRRSGKK